MNVRPLAYLLFATAAPLAGATVDERLDRLEAEVSEMSLLLRELRDKSSTHFESPHLDPSSSPRYRIRPGDSYWSIARRYQITVSALEAANPGINPRKLSIGKTLKIPFPKTSTTNSRKSSSMASHRGTYTVRKGDILGRISESHGIRLHQLLEANPGLNPRKLRIGTVLSIPGQNRENPKVDKIPERKAPPKEEKKEVIESTPIVEQRPEIRPNPPEIRESSPFDLPPLDLPKSKLVVVENNSRFVELATRYNTTVAELNQLNDVELSPDQMIKKGSQLYVPGN